MNFMLSWQKQYLTRSLRSLVRYYSCHSNIKFISSRHRVISCIYLFHVSFGRPSDSPQENWTMSTRTISSFENLTRIWLPFGLQCQLKENTANQYTGKLLWTVGKVMCAGHCILMVWYKTVMKYETELYMPFGQVINIFSLLFAGWST